ncbi:MAG: 3-hydroxybutyryl-CoA dehydrogenase, partial [Mesorhizobium sp.]
MNKIETIGIIGAGQMGGGIAHVSALAGYKVLVYDISP